MDINEILAKIDENEKFIADLEAYVDDLEAKLREYENGTAAPSAGNSEYTERIRELEEALKEKKRHIERLERELNEREGASQAAGDENNEIINNLKSEIKIMNDNNMKKDKEINKLKAEIKTLQESEGDVFISPDSDYKRMYDEAQDELEKQDDEIKELKEKVQKLEDGLEKAKASGSGGGNEKEIEALKAQSEDLKSEIAEKKGIIEELKEKLSESENSHTDSEEQAELLEKIKALETENSRLKEASASDGDSDFIAELKAENEKKDKTIAELERSLKNGESFKTLDGGAEVSELLEKLQEKNKQIEALNDELDKAVLGGKNKLKDKEIEIEDLRNENRQIKRTLMSLEEFEIKSDNLSKKLKVTEAEKDELNELLIKQSEQIKALNEEIGEQRSKNETLEKQIRQLISSGVSSSSHSVNVPEKSSAEDIVPKASLQTQSEKKTDEIKTSEIDEITISHMNEIYNAYLKGGEKLPADLFKPIMLTGMGMRVKQDKTNGLLFYYVQVGNNAVIYPDSEVYNKKYLPKFNRKIYKSESKGEKKLIEPTLAMDFDINSKFIEKIKPGLLEY